MNVNSEINVYELDVPELRRIAVGSLTQPPGTWENQWSNLGDEIPDGRVAMLGAYKVTDEGAEEPVGLCGIRIVDNPVSGQEPGPYTIGERTANALIRLAETRRQLEPGLGLTALEEGIPGAAAANFAAILVAPGARRQGVATKLHEYRSQLLATRFPDRPFPVFLTVAESNTSARALDEMQGFTVLEEGWGGKPYMIIRDPHHPPIDDQGNYPPVEHNVPFLYMGKLLVPRHLTAGE